MKEVRSFLGFCSYYREFIPGFAQISAPIQRLVVGKGKGTRAPPFDWTPEADVAFQEVKQLFARTPVLRYPNETDLFILDTDASNDSIGAVLSQVQNGVEVPLAFASNSLSKTQRNYCTTKRELLAVVVYTKKYRHYLYGGNFRCVLIGYHGTSPRYEFYQRRTRPRLSRALYKGKAETRASPTLIKLIPRACDMITYLLCPRFLRNNGRNTFNSLAKVQILTISQTCALRVLPPHRK